MTFPARARFLAALLLGTALATPALASGQGSAARGGFEGMEVMQATIDPMARPAMPAMVVQAHAQALRPAPLPDQDMDAPGLSADEVASQQQASLNPHVFAPVGQHFSGDGFSQGASLDKDRVNRSRPGGGMSLSIPMP
jgi:hypothetical protein